MSCAIEHRSGQLVRFSSIPQSPTNSPIRPHQREVRQIEMMLGAATKQGEIFKVQVGSISGDILLEVVKIDKHQLLSLENPRCKQCLAKYVLLEGIEMGVTHPRS